MLGTWRPSHTLRTDHQTCSWQISVSPALETPLEQLCSLLIQSTYFLTNPTVTELIIMSPCRQLSPKNTPGISLPAWRILQAHYCTNALLCTNDVSLFTIKRKAILLKSDVIILFILQPGYANVRHSFSRWKDNKVKLKEFSSTKNQDIEDKMTLGTLQAFLYFTGLFLAGILPGHVQELKWQKNVI